MQLLFCQLARVAQILPAATPTDSKVLAAGLNSIFGGFQQFCQYGLDEVPFSLQNHCPNAISRHCAADEKHQPRLFVRWTFRETRKW